MSLVPTGWIPAQSPEVPPTAWITCVRRVAPEDVEAARADLVRTVDRVAADHAAVVYVLVPPTALPLATGKEVRVASKGTAKGGSDRPLVDVFTDVAFRLPHQGGHNWYRPKVEEGRSDHASTFIDHGG